MPLKLIVANKAYSSWSLRPWILLAHFKIPFEETVIPLDLPETHERILEHSPNGKCPGADRRIDHRLGIAFGRRIYRRNATQRRRSGRAARRRGHTRVRSPPRCTLASRRCGRPARRNFRRPARRIALTEAVEADVARIEAAWAHARKTFGTAGPFLFGRFSAADAMFAPVVNRLHTYDIPVSRRTRDYMSAMMALPAWKAWIADAEAEEWRIDKYEARLTSAARAFCSAPRRVRARSGG